MTIEELPDDEGNPGSEVPGVEGIGGDGAGGEVDDGGVDSEIADCEEDDGVDEQAIGQESAVERLEYGPHQKLSRGDEQYSYQKEVELAKGKKFICSLDLLLGLFVDSCRSPGCKEVPQVKHHLVGATVVVNTFC